MLTYSVNRCLIILCNYLSVCALQHVGGSALELLLGPDGEYIREMIIDELAKGIDAGWRSSVDSFVGSARHRLLGAFGVTPSPFLSCVTLHSSVDSFVGSGGHRLLGAFGVILAAFGCHSLRCSGIGTGHLHNQL